MSIIEADGLTATNNVVLQASQLFKVVVWIPYLWRKVLKLDSSNIQACLTNAQIYPVHEGVKLHDFSCGCRDLRIASFANPVQIIRSQQGDEIYIFDNCWCRCGSTIKHYNGKIQLGATIGEYRLLSPSFAITARGKNNENVVIVRKPQSAQPMQINQAQAVFNDPFPDEASENLTSSVFKTAESMLVSAFIVPHSVFHSVFQQFSAYLQHVVNHDNNVVETCSSSSSPEELASSQTVGKWFTTLSDYEWDTLAFHIEAILRYFPGFAHFSWHRETSNIVITYLIFSRSEIPMWILHVQARIMERCYYFNNLALPNCFYADLSQWIE